MLGLKQKGSVAGITQKPRQEYRHRFRQLHGPGLGALAEDGDLGVVAVGLQVAPAKPADLADPRQEYLSILPTVFDQQTPPSDRRDESILRRARLNNFPSTVAGIHLFTSIDKTEGFQKRHIPPHGFPVPPECHCEF